MQPCFERFWMVWGAGKDQPQRKHSTPESAFDEAERLALRHPGTAFYVLVSVRSCSVATVSWREAVSSGMPEDA